MEENMRGSRLALAAAVSVAVAVAVTVLAATEENAQDFMDIHKIEKLILWLEYPCGLPIALYLILTGIGFPAGAERRIIREQRQH
jgi:hypothetical protein